MPFTDAQAPERDRTAVVGEYRVLVREAEQLLDDVDRALAALDDGSYGSCEVCGAAVDDRTLEEDPLVTRCAWHGAAG